MNGIMYPGDDGSEPEEVRNQKAEEYKTSVEANAETRKARRDKVQSVAEEYMARPNPMFPSETETEGN